MIIFFADKHEPRLEEVGGKGLNLIHMTQRGLAVPEGFVITTAAYDRFIQENKLTARIDQLITGLSADNMQSLEHASQKIKELFASATMPAKVSEDISAASAQLDQQLLAVRSSATAEDLADMSFAGQHNTFLNVSGREELLASVKKCWASLWNARAISYRLKHGVKQDNNSILLAVVVQIMAHSEKAGVMFTVNPRNNRRDQILIDSSWGLGEAVVSGMVTPDQYIVNKDNGQVEEERIATKEVQIVRGVGTNSVIAVPARLQNKSSLDQAEIAMLHEMAKDVDAYYRRPMDTEWVIGDGKAYIVQARPVTSLHPMAEVHDDKAEHGLRVYFSFTRVAQGISAPFTPMGLEVQRLEMWGAGKALGYQLGTSPRACKTAAGRVYWDITELVRKPKFATGLAGGLGQKDPVAGKVLLEFVERNRAELASRKTSIKIPLKMFAFLGRCLLIIIRSFRQPQKAEERCIALANNHLKKMEQKKNDCRSIEDKLHLIEEIMAGAMEIIILQTTSFVPAYKAEQSAAGKLEQWFGSRQLLDPVLLALPNSPTTQMGYRLVWIAVKLKEEGVKPTPDHPLVQEFLAEYGHRSNNELDVGHATWQEDPEYIINLIDSYQQQDPDVLLAKLDNQKAEAKKAIDAIVSKVESDKGKGQAKKIQKECDYIRALLGLRERPKFDLIRSFALVRQLLQEIGADFAERNIIAEVNDVFFLQRSEILSGTGPLFDKVAERKEAFSQQKDIKTVPRFMTNTGESLYESMLTVEGDGLQGAPISAGEYTGTVRVIHDPEKAELKSGEILVTHSTDPSWTPLFFNAGALVMETGGTASHGGIVAREYGIPAVAGIERLSEKLQTGDRVTVNGYTGQVIIEELANK